MGESNSRLSDANRLHYHYANGPILLILEIQKREALNYQALGSMPKSQATLNPQTAKPNSFHQV